MTARITWRWRRTSPQVAGATVLHLHTRPGGLVPVGDRLLTGAEFGGVLNGLGIGAGPLVLVACDGAAIAAEVAALTGRPVVAAATAVVTSARRVVAVRLGVSADGTPLLSDLRQSASDWTLAQPPGERGQGALAASSLGSPDLLALLRSGVLGEQPGLQARELDWGRVGDREVWWSARPGKRQRRGQAPGGQTAPRTGEGIAGLLRAERAAWVALSIAARQEQPPDGWLQRGRQAIDDARQETDRALDDRIGDTGTDARILVGLRAAVSFWRQLSASGSASEPPGSWKAREQLLAAG